MTQRWHKGVSLNGRVTNFEADQLRGLASVGGSGGWEREEEKQVCVCVGGGM